LYWKRQKDKEFSKNLFLKHNPNKLTSNIIEEELTSKPYHTDDKESIDVISITRKLKRW